LERTPPKSGGGSGSQVKHAIISGDKQEQHTKIAEFIDVLRLSERCTVEESRIVELANLSN
jgi:hypothetical protein